jgi:hypothetical protein
LADAKISALTAATTVEATDEFAINDTATAGVSGTSKRATALMMATYVTANTTTIELGHASDTTLARSSAGNMSIEGNVVYRAGGTDVPLADGGTGASLADPGADRIMFWDESANAVDWLTAGSTLTISGTSIDVTTAAPAAAAQSDQETATSTTTYVSPGRQHFHPSAAKFWVYWTGNSTTILSSYNMTSIANTTTGDADGTIGTDFSDANWAGFVSTSDSTATGWDADSIQSSGFNAKAAGTFGVLCGVMVDGGTAAGNTTNPQQWQVVGFGDHA